MKVNVLIWVCALVAFSVAAEPAVAQKAYDPGASDTVIRIGNTVAYSGPASAYGTLGKADAAYFEMVNAHGGINGRKIEFISRDDAFSPPKTVEQTRRLVEEDRVLFMFNSLGTAPNSAVQKYLNGAKVPQLFIAAGGRKFTDIANFPWTMAFQPNFNIEAKIYAKFILSNYPDAKIAVLYQSDDLGKDYLAGLKEGLGERAGTMVVGEAAYQITDATIDSQMVALKATGANVFFSASTPKFAAQAIRKAAELGWKPVHILTGGVSSVGAVLRPAGLDNSIGVITATASKDPTDPKWHDDPGYLAWAAWMKKYYPEGDMSDALNVGAYTVSETIVQVLTQAGDNLTRANVMKQALNLDFKPSMTLPGIRVKTSPTQSAPVTSMQLQRFDGKQWVLFGDIISQ
ncbi:MULTISPECIES: ABC transporter substrate-binding protein [unclassified Bradyrhizobium]|uniref:ABC transporter substrate-binding protein n=1 Tax=unclassified Bradyrhizobium TaxID=2631580 RepID=UPI001BA5E8DE|nr:MULTISPECIES: ABC transporter substrate-binding protein [unclassified Bradyrhizobium]MBR1202956.1 ABC transporter substrate-binding protein [Bradyrhizobium sp. AUGA SZCCT0124]MBR1314370.1 ABC transporter substrate-binding protein [Bradyrhizobium sp. AUGA SZCCT0051]MBR1342612.1 ABC transporter substrate-binding protein [Bradyrhizobium sp. AUGA SZCCT0105]MBR1352841.1 ABC transporter substrate-binding protein [Bradyrhizobium sp. AUGA SZCCT0045]